MSIKNRFTGIAGVLAALAIPAGAVVVTLARASPQQIEAWHMRARSAHDWPSMLPLHAAALAGNERAAYALGSVQIASNDADEVRDGLAWLERSARSGDVQAQFDLGTALFQGTEHVPPDYAASRHWLERAAASLPAQPPAIADDDEHNELDVTPAAWAAYRLASIWRNGYGVTRDTAKGSAWLERAAQNGVPQAQFQLANVYRERGDEAQALTWLHRAAHAELPEANLALAMAYRNGEMGLNRDDGAYWTYVKETLHDYKHRVVR